MSAEEEPNAGDILASSLGVYDLQGHVWALHILLTSLFFVLREKGAIDAKQIDMIFDATSAAVSEKFERLSRETPKGVEHFREIRDGATKMLEVIRRDLAAAPSSQ